MPESKMSGRGVASLGGYRPGLDGVRALAVIAVLAFHGTLPGSDGGFLGVSLFFTLSGFLITTILLDGSLGTGTVDLGRFWARRFRRLAPAALLGLAVAAVLAATVASPSQVDALPGQLAAAVVYLTNWQFILADQSYGDLFAAPSLVQHYWSLAIEEQFYLVLPLALTLLLRVTRSRRVLAGAFALTAVASAVWTAVLFESGASIDRLYYGTDTRLAELVVGCALATVVHRIGTAWSTRTRHAFSWAGTLSLVVLVWFWSRWTFQSEILWKGGLALHAALTAIVIVGVLTERGPLHLLLSFSPLVALGRISYGVYLFHWPIFLWLDEARTGLSVWPLFALRIAVTLAISVASYRFVEMPIRNGAPLLRRPARNLALIPAVGGVLFGLALVAASVRGDAAPEAFEIDDDELAIPVLSDDGVLDVVVISSTSGRSLTDGVVSELSADPRIEVHEVVPLACTGGLVDTADGSRTCMSWVQEWSDLTSEYDPDMVLFVTDGWEGDDLVGLAGDAPRDQRAFVVETLGAGLDLVTTESAPVLWVQPAVPASSHPQIDATFRAALTELEFGRSDIFTTLRADLALADDVQALQVEHAIEDIGLYQRADYGDLPRVFVIGDSQAQALGSGLARWGSAAGEAIVWSAGTPGCGLLTEGSVERLGRVGPVSAECRAVVEALPSRIRSFEPDVVVVLSSFFDTSDRELDGTSLTLGDAQLDEYVISAYADLVDLLSADGAHVVWMTAPCPDTENAPSELGPVAQRLDPERLAVLNGTILPALAERRTEAVSVFDLDDVLCPDGVAQTESEGIVLRPDGVHLSREGATWFAEEYGPGILSSAGAGD